MFRTRTISPQNHNSELTEDKVPIRKLYVNNFTGTTTESDLRTVFEKYGTVVDVVIVKNAKTNKVFAFVTFADTKSTKKAREEKIIFKGRRLMVRPADSWHQPDLEQATSAPIQSEDESEINDAESLLLLNDDCLLKILSLLDLKDLLAMGKTCWRLNNVAEMIYKTKKEFDLSDQDSDLTMMNVRNILEALGPFLTHFKASGFTFHARNDLLLSTVAKYCQNLTALSLEDFKITYKIRNLHVLFKNLKKLDLKKCHVTDRDLSILIKGSGGNQIEHVNLSYNYEIAGSCLTHFKNLKVANLSDCGNIQPKHLISFFDQNTTLEDLNIIHCKRVNLECITAIASKLTSLKKLNLCNNYDGINPNNYLPLADLPSLIHLQINFSDYVSADPFLLKLSEKNQLEYLDISNAHMTKGTIKAFEHMTKLKVLKVNYKVDFDNKTLKIISEMKDLEELEIVGGVGITNEGLLNLVNKCKHIRRMDISGCFGITNSFILDVMNIVEGRPQILTLVIGGTQIDETIYIDNLLKPSKFIKLNYDNTTDSYYPDLDDYSDSDDSDEFFEYDEYGYGSDYYESSDNDYLDDPEEFYNLIMSYANSF